MGVVWRSDWSYGCRVAFWLIVWVSCGVLIDRMGVVWRSDCSYGCVSCGFSRACVSAVSYGICIQWYGSRCGSPQLAWKTCDIMWDHNGKQGNQRWQIHRPATCQCLATFTPLKSKNLIFFSWRHFSARSSFYIINWYGYPRGSHEKYLKEIVSPVFKIRHWIVTC